MRSRPWTDHEQAQLRQTYRTMPLALLAQHFNRTPNAVYQRAHALGIAKRQRRATDCVIHESTADVDRRLALIDRLKRRARWAA
jgi:hypothetical protein